MYPCLGSCNYRLYDNTVRYTSSKQIASTLAFWISFLAFHNHITPCPSVHAVTRKLQRHDSLIAPMHLCLPCTDIVLCTAPRTALPYNYLYITHLNFSCKSIIQELCFFEVPFILLSQSKCRDVSSPKLSI